MSCVLNSYLLTYLLITTVSVMEQCSKKIQGNWHLRFNWKWQMMVCGMFGDKHLSLYAGYPEGFSNVAQ